MNDTDQIATIRRRLANIVQWVPDLGGIVAEAKYADRDLDALARELAEAQARAKAAERKAELYEWMAYQRRRNPGISDDDILRLTYVPEWRDLDAPDNAPTDPMATTVTPRQREAVVRDLIREARDEEDDDNTAWVISWLWSRIPSDFDPAPGDTEGE